MMWGFCIFVICSPNLAPLILMPAAGDEIFLKKETFFIPLSFEIGIDINLLKLQWWRLDINYNVITVTLYLQRVIVFT